MYMFYAPSVTACAIFNLEKFHGPDSISNNIEPAANQPMLRSDRNRLLLNIKIYRLASDEPSIQIIELFVKSRMYDVET